MSKNTTHGHGHPASAGAQAEEELPEGGVPLEIEELPGHQLRAPPKDQATHTLQKSRDRAQKTGTDFPESLFSDKSDFFLAVLTLIVQFWLLRLGITQDLTSQGHPLNAKLLVPALDAILEAAPLFAADAPKLLRDLGPETAVKRKERLSFLYKVQEALAPLNQGLEALVTHLEQTLDGKVRGYMNQGKATLGTAFANSRTLAVAHQWHAGAVVQGQDTRKANTRLVDKTTGQVLTQVEDVLREASAHPPAPPKPEDLVKELSAKPQKPHKPHAKK